jgi:hypothetical protein
LRASSAPPGRISQDHEPTSNVRKNISSVSLFESFITQKKNQHPFDLKAVTDSKPSLYVININVENNANTSRILVNEELKKYTELFCSRNMLKEYLMAHFKDVILPV